MASRPPEVGSVHAGVGSTSLRHVRVKGWQRKRVKGSPRRFRLSIRINSQLYLALQLAASTKHVTVSALVERMVWESLSKMASGNITERLRHVHALINEIVAEEGVQRFHAQGHREKTTRRDIHGNVEEQDRRNLLSEKTTLALEQLFDLTQSEPVKMHNPGLQCTMS